MTKDQLEEMEEWRGGGVAPEGWADHREAWSPMGIVSMLRIADELPDGRWVEGQSGLEDPSRMPKDSRAAVLIWSARVSHPNHPNDGGAELPSQRIGTIGDPPTATRCIAAQNRTLAALFAQDRGGTLREEVLR